MNAVNQHQFGKRHGVYVPRSLEPMIRNRVLEGVSITQIAKQFGADEHRLRNFIGSRIDRWRREGPVVAPPADGKTIVYKPRVTKNGDIIFKPISLPFVTMHAQALKEKRRG